MPNATPSLEVFHASDPVHGWDVFGPAIDLPAARAATEVFVWVGRRGAGKSYGCGVFVEELLEAKLPVIVIDVVGTWWGLRVGADGSPSGGYKIPVIGGDHGDIGIVAEGGAAVASMLVDTGSSAILDLSPLRKGQRQRFMTDWAEEFFHKKKSDRGMVHVVLEEAHTLIPQRVMKGQERMLGALEDLVRLGRNYGIGVSMLDQRPQSVNKDVLNQAEVLCAFQLTGAQERDAVRRWAEAKEKGDAFNPNTQPFNELSKLPAGQCILWSPEWLKRCQRVQVGKKRTFDASATPGRTEQVRARAMREIDLAELQKAMDKAAGKKPNDPQRIVRSAEDREPVSANAPDVLGLMNENARLKEELELEKKRAEAACNEAEKAQRDLVAFRNLWARLMSSRVRPIRDACDELEKMFASDVAPTDAPNGMRAVANNWAAWTKDVAKEVAPWPGGKHAYMNIGADRCGDCGEDYEHVNHIPRTLDAPALMDQWKASANPSHRYSNHDGDGPCAACGPPPLYNSALADFLGGAPDPSLTPITRAILNTLAKYGPLTQAQTLSRANYARSGNTDKAFAEIKAKGWVVAGNYGGGYGDKEGKNPIQLSLTGAGATALGEFEEIALPGLDKMERALLTALAQPTKPLTQKQILINASYARSGSTDTAFARFKKNEWVVEEDGALRITDWGREVLGPFEVLPTGKALTIKLIAGAVGNLSELERRLLATLHTRGGGTQKEILEAAQRKRSGNTDKAFAHLVALGYAKRNGGVVNLAEELRDP